MIRKIKETKTEEYFLVSRSQLEFVYDLFNKMGIWKMLEIMGMERKSKEEDLISDFWRDIENAFKDDE